MADPELAQVAQQWVNDAFVWIGFGTVAGLMAKAIMPGRDPGGSVVTLSLGIGGALVGCGILAYSAPDYRVSPLTPIGFVVATAGAFVLLFFYRLMAGRIIREGGDGHPVARPFYSRRRTRVRDPIYDDGPYRE